MTVELFLFDFESAASFFDLEKNNEKKKIHLTWHGKNLWIFYYLLDFLSSSFKYLWNHRCRKTSSPPKNLMSKVEEYFCEFFWYQRRRLRHKAFNSKSPLFSSTIKFDDCMYKVPHKLCRGSLNFSVIYLYIVLSKIMRLVSRSTSSVVQGFD